MVTTGQSVLCPAESYPPSHSYTSNNQSIIQNTNNAARGEKVPRPRAKPLHHANSISDSMRPRVKRYRALVRSPTIQLTLRVSNTYPGTSGATLRV